VEGLHLMKPAKVHSRAADATASPPAPPAGPPTPHVGPLAPHASPPTPLMGPPAFSLIARSFFRAAVTRSSMSH
ncbi:hypothetical protein Tco_1489895, partial [Tanacetum coccineum]